MKLSIIVPAYNIEEYISLTLDSLTAIHFLEDYEILVINDGSTDRTAEIVREYQEQNRSVCLYTIENGGVSNARNYGMKHAKGEYISFLDGDDTVDPYFFEIAITELDNNNYAFVQGNYLVVDSYGEYKQQFVEDDVEITNRQEMINFFFGKEKKIHNAVWGKVYRKSAVGDVLFEMNRAVAEDQKFVFDIINRATSIKLINHIGVYYVQRQTSAMHVFNINKERDKYDVLEYCKKRISDSKIIKYIEQQQIDILFEIYWSCVKTENALAKSVRNELMQYDLKKCYRMSKKRRILLTMFQYAPWILNLYIRGIK